MNSKVGRIKVDSISYLNNKIILALVVAYHTYTGTIFLLMLKPFLNHGIIKEIGLYAIL